jgi:multimeric flavodoxin WrbA
LGIVLTRVFVANVGTEKGLTTKLLDPFLEGIHAGGGEVDDANIRRLDIRPCTGEFNCWYRKPGRCHIGDDMQELYPRISSAEVLIFSAPVYLPIPGELQNFLNRLMPLIDPLVESKEGKTRATVRPEVRWKRLAIVSTSGWWEIENFDVLVMAFQEFARKVGIDFAGAVLRPHAFLMAKANERSEAILSAVRESGRTLIETGAIPLALQRRIAEPLAKEEEVIEIYNKMRTRSG